MLASQCNFTGIIQDITAIHPSSKAEEDRLASLMEKQARPFEQGGNSCKQCGERLAIQDYFGHYDVVFHVKGYECPKCGHTYIDRSPLKTLKEVAGEWTWVEGESRVFIQKWTPMRASSGKAGNQV